MATEHGLTNNEARLAIYNQELGTTLATGDIAIHIRESYMMENERNFKMAVLMTLLTGLGFLFSLFGMWRP